MSTSSALPVSLTFVSNETAAGIAERRVLLLVELLIVVHTTIDLVIGLALHFFVDFLRTFENRLLIVLQIGVDVDRGCRAHVPGPFRLSRSIRFEFDVHVLIVTIRRLHAADRLLVVAVVLTLATLVRRTAFARSHQTLLDRTR